MKDGGAAFPLAVNRDKHTEWDYGMTLRDYFAAKAMQGMLSNPSMIDTHDKHGKEWIANHSYEQADAMLAERDKKD